MKTRQKILFVAVLATLALCINSFFLVRSTRSNPQPAPKEQAVTETNGVVYATAEVTME